MKRNNLRIRYYKQQIRCSRKRNIKPLLASLFLISLWYLLIGRDLLPEVFNEKEEQVETTIPVAYDTPCTEANFTKLIAYTLSEKIELEEGQEDAQWYSPYYKLLAQKGITLLREENAQKLVDKSLFEKVLKEILSEKDAQSIVFETKSGYEGLNLQEVTDTYYSVLKKANYPVNMNYIELVILATPAEGKTLGAWQVETDQGKFDFKGLIIEPLKNKTVKVAVKDHEILSVMEITKEESILEACLLTEITDEIVTATIQESTITLKNNGLGKALVGSQGELTINGNGVVAFKEQEYHEKDVVLKVTDQEIVLEKAGALKYDKVSVTDSTDIGTYSSIQALPYGTQIAYKEEEGKIVALQVIGRSSTEGIRVVLSNETGGYYHEWVKFVSPAEYDINYNGMNSILNKQSVWDSESFKWEKGANTICFVPKEDSTLKLFNFKKNDIFPKYKGSFEITKTEKGYILINVVDLEDYVAAVIPSEMPTSYGLEALKVQAIAARTYAVASKQGSKFMSYGAQIDDTTASQVYNAIAPNELAYEAAAATSGQVISDEGNIISSKFFATSCGYTANLGEVWASGENFPGNSPDYLVAVPQYEGKLLVDNLKEETTAYKFFTLSPKEVNAYDCDSPWFRWQVTLSQEELSDFVNTAIGKMSTNYPNQVKVLNKKGDWVSQDVSTLGAIQKVEVIERGEGGNIMTLLLKGSKATVKVSTEYLIRNLFAATPKHHLKIIRSDGSEVNHLSLLPSAFFSPKLTYNNKEFTSITLYGGGFGHGVGMSQDGVRGMTEKGYDYKKIIEHYYPSAKLISIEK